MHLSGTQKGSEDGIMQVGDLVMLRRDMFNDRLLGVLTKKTNLLGVGWYVLWSNGIKSHHPQRNLEVVCE